MQELPTPSCPYTFVWHIHACTDVCAHIHTKCKKKTQENLILYWPRRENYSIQGQLGFFFLYIKTQLFKSHELNGGMQVLDNISFASTWIFIRLQISDIGNVVVCIPPQMKIFHSAQTYVMKTLSSNLFVIDELRQKN